MSNATKTECVRGHEFTEANTRWVTGGHGRQRKCRTCIRAYNYETKFGAPHPTGGLTPLRTTSMTKVTR